MLAGAICSLKTTTTDTAPCTVGRPLDSTTWGMGHCYISGRRGIAAVRLQQQLSIGAGWCCLRKQLASSNGHRTALHQQQRAS
jgi:hypothetical protein